MALVVCCFVVNEFRLMFVYDSGGAVRATFAFEWFLTASVCFLFGFMELNCS